MNAFSVLDTHCNTLHTCNSKHRFYIVGQDIWKVKSTEERLDFFAYSIVVKTVKLKERGKIVCTHWY